MWIGDRVVIGCNEFEGGLAVCAWRLVVRRSLPQSPAPWRFLCMAGYVTYEIADRWDCELSVEVFGEIAR